MACSGGVLELFDLVPAEPSRADLGTGAQALLALLGAGPLTADEIARAAGIEPAPFSASLTELADGRIYRPVYEVLHGVGDVAVSQA